MRSRVRLRFAEPLLKAAAGAPETAMLEVEPELGPRDETIFLLHTAAEIEHSLMVQYLYAGWSLPPDGPGLVRRWRRELLQVAREEMAHFAAVQNLLRFVGGPLNFDREDFPFRTELYPFPFQLERLSRASLARYVAAEMPMRPDADPGLIDDVIAATEVGAGHPVNRVGALYQRLIDLVGDGEALPDTVFRPDTASAIQARPTRYRADDGHGPYFVRTVDSRAAAVALLADVAGQGEGEQDMVRSHFTVFLDVFDRWPAGDATSRDVPTDPTTTSDGSDAGRITHPRAAGWAEVFNQHYRLLLGWLQHALLTPADAAAATGLSLRAFGEMLVLSDVGELLTTLPRTADGEGRAGAPFELPYTLALPDQPRDRWDAHRDLLTAARKTLDGIEPEPADDPVRRRLLSMLTAAQGFIDTEANR
jgi:hypothetical protein